jgi:hypothetical protein
MHGFWLFVHMLGMVLWLGGGLATMVAGVTAKQFSPESRIAAYRLTSAVQRVLVGPGASAVVLSGVALSVRFMKEGAIPGWLVLMMTTGIPAAVIALGVAVPTAARLGRLDLDSRGELPEQFSGLRARLVRAASIAGGLGLIALAAGTVLRT